MIAGIMGRKEQLLEAIFWINEEQQGGDCHVATSPRRNVTKSRRRVNKLQKSTISPTSRRQLENLHLIIKCQRAQNLGHWRTCGGRHENREQSNTAFKELLGILYHFSIVLDIFGSHDDVFHTIHFVSFLHDVLNLFLGLHQTLSQTMD